MGVHKYNFNNVTISKKVSLRSHFVIKKDGKGFCENTDNNKYCLRSPAVHKDFEADKTAAKQEKN